ncbi:hypothetical protein DL767_010630 [Monosporascus sp. MG133]|nr:hypothetical protein DL767_010630 [Monosporascus sp. MG133]
MSIFSRLNVWITAIVDQLAALGYEPRSTSEWLQRSIYEAYLGYAYRLYGGPMGSYSDLESLSRLESHGYRTLDPSRREIRLLVIMPRDFRILARRSHVCCFTMTTPVEHAAEFTALSYVWGDPAVRKPIMLDNAVVQVTANLANALEHLERRDGEVFLGWIDALCINQADLVEKSQQVPMMHAIYERAASVVVWLGQETPSTTFAFQKMLGICMEVKRLLDENRDRDGDGTSPEDQPPWQPFGFSGAVVEYMRRAVLSDDGQLLFDMSGILEIARNPWWQRVGRETFAFTYAQVFFHNMGRLRDFCLRGQHTGSNEGLIRAAATKKELSVDLIPPNRMLLVADAKKEWDLKDLLVMTNELQMFAFQATRPEDQIYALLGLAADADALGIVPDYTREVRDVYVDTARAILESSEDLDIIYYSQFPKRIELPSWVPDWTMGLKGYVDTRWRGVFSVCGTIRSEIIDAGSKDILGACGVTFDTVSSVLQERWRGDLWSQPDDRSNRCIVKEQIRHFLASTQTYINKHAHAYSEDHRRREILWRLLTMGIGLELGAALKGDLICNRIACDKTHDEFLLFYHLIIGESGPTDAVFIPTYPYYSLVSHRLDGRRIFVSTKGFIGVGPDSVQADDRICILYGGVSPFILRPVSTERRYQLVGDAWVHGIMNGEFMMTDREKEIFILQ